jgi:hypothetical protein
MRCGGPIAWGCMREPKTSRSSCEAEIYALDEGTKTVEMIRHLMEDLGLPDVNQPTPLLNDNQGSVNWSHGASVSKKLRHINIREISVRDGVRLKYSHVLHIPGIFNVSDIFTKEHKAAETFARLAGDLIHPRQNTDLRHDSEDKDPGGCWKELVSLIPEGCGLAESRVNDQVHSSDILRHLPVEVLRGMAVRLLTAIQ